jgi:malate dehydrogenase (oxaloacetate-decarboxylating)(NADP+)
MYTAQPGAVEGTREMKPPATALDDAGKNKDTAFSQAERTALGLTGLLPPKVFTLDEQARLAMHQFAQIQRPLDRYVFLMALQVWTSDQ